MSESLKKYLKWIWPIGMLLLAVFGNRLVMDNGAWTLLEGSNISKATQYRLEQPKALAWLLLFWMLAGMIVILAPRSRPVRFQPPNWLNLGAFKISNSVILTFLRILLLMGLGYWAYKYHQHFTWQEMAGWLLVFGASIGWFSPLLGLAGVKTDFSLTIPRLLGTIFLAVCMTQPLYSLLTRTSYLQVFEAVDKSHSIMRLLKEDPAIAQDFDQSAQSQSTGNEPKEEQQFIFHLLKKVGFISPREIFDEFKANPLFVTDKDGNRSIPEETPQGLLLFKVLSSIYEGDLSLIRANTDIQLTIKLSNYLSGLDSKELGNNQGCVERVPPVTIMNAREASLAAAMASWPGQDVKDGFFGDYINYVYQKSTNDAQCEIYKQIVDGIPLYRAMIFELPKLPDINRLIETELLLNDLAVRSLQGKLKLNQTMIEQHLQNPKPSGGGEKVDEPQILDLGQPGHEQLKQVIEFQKWLLNGALSDTAVKTALRNRGVVLGYEQAIMIGLTLFMMLFMGQRAALRWHVLDHLPQVLENKYEANSEHLSWLLQFQQAARKLITGKKLAKGPTLHEKKVDELLSWMMEQEQDRQHHSRWLIRWGAKALPGIGFIGTVRGIMLALGGADAIVRAGGKAAQATAVTDVASILGIAFATTLIALILGLTFSLIDDFQAKEELQFLDGVRETVRKSVCAEAKTNSHEAM